MSRFTEPSPGPCYTGHMRLLALTYGTEGDTRPLTLLCRGLIDAGHQVLLLADGGTLGSARALDVPHAALQGDIHEEVVALLSRGNSPRAASSGLARMARRHVADWMRQADQAASGCEAVLAGGLAAFVGLSVAERHGIPVIGTGMIPITPTRAFPSPFLPPGWTPPPLNRLSHRLVTRLIWQQFRAPINQARRAVLGLSPATTPWIDAPMLYGVSPSLVATPADWPADHRVCGQWRLPDSTGWSPAPALQAFLDAGPPPVYVGFGSMTGFDRDAVLSALLRMLEGRRVLLSPGWSGTPALALPGNVHVVGAVPHEALFPLTSLVIHHGGSGTTHSACRAGVPSMVMPFAADQFFWADRLHRLGVAPPALSPRRLDSQRLSAALAVAEHPDVRARATALGRRMATEDGVAIGVAAVGQLLGQPATNGGAMGPSASARSRSDP